MARKHSKKTEDFVGAVRVNKNYVCFHLMAVYTNPGLVETLSPELQKRMQGKSCFNFRAVDEGLFAELEELMERALRRDTQMARAPKTITRCQGDRRAPSAAAPEAPRTWRTYNATRAFATGSAKASPLIPAGANQPRQTCHMPTLLPPSPTASLRPRDSHQAIASNLGHHSEGTWARERMARTSSFLNDASSVCTCPPVGAQDRAVA